MAQQTFMGGIIAEGAEQRCLSHRKVRIRDEQTTIKGIRADKELLRENTM